MRVDRKLLEEVYRENYFKGEEYVDYERDKAVLQHNFSRRLNQLTSIVTFSEGQSVTEIGCAYGFFGEIVLRSFPFLRYEGYDVVPEACHHAKHSLNLDVKCVDFLDVPDASPSDHVFMWDVIEHLNNPQIYLQKINRLLKEQGKIYLTTGDISALLPRLQGRRWRMIHPPSHLHYFSKRTLTLLLEKQGFRVLRVYYPPTARSLKQIYYSLFMLKSRPSRLASFIYRRIPADTYVSINTYDIMMLVAEKSSTPVKGAVQ